MPAKTFREVLRSDQFIVTAEISPTKGTDTTKMIEHIELLREEVHALNATDNKSALMRYPAIGHSLLIKELGGEPVLNITCRDRNRLAIQADLLFAWSRGISTVLCLIGDSMEFGEDKQAKSVSDLDCMQLISLVQALNSGKDMAGGELTGGADFCIGVTATAHSKPVEIQEDKLQKKLAMHVDFLVTQAIYEVDSLKQLVAFIKKQDSRVKVIAGIMPLVSVAMGRYINSNIPGMFVPDRVLAEMAQAPRGQSVATGIKLAAKLLKHIKEEKICDGVHLVFPGREERILDVIEISGLG
ncbi:MAG: methylenetetrahydrofolate reductase [Dehalococcoidales bacterium]|jgi:5,10-methylenetetrahydrofolate reductase